MQLVSIRLETATVERLRSLARREAARRNQDVTWPMLVREMIDRRLDEEQTPHDTSERPS
jgi:hypothetical protein